MLSSPGRLTAPSMPGGSFAEWGKDLSCLPFTLHVAGISRFFLKPSQQLCGLFILTLPQNIKQTAGQPPGSTDLLLLPPGRQRNCSWQELQPELPCLPAWPEKATEQQRPVPASPPPVTNQELPPAREVTDTAEATLTRFGACCGQPGMPEGARNSPTAGRRHQHVHPPAATQGFGLLGEILPQPTRGGAWPSESRVQGGAGR